MPLVSSCRICCQFSALTQKCPTSNPLTQFALSNPRSQPDTHFAVDMFPYKKTELFQKSGFKSKPPKKPGNTPLSGLYLSFLDINTTVSSVLPLSQSTPNTFLLFFHQMLSPFYFLGNLFNAFKICFFDWRQSNLLIFSIFRFCFLQCLFMTYRTSSS